MAWSFIFIFAVLAIAAGLVLWSFGKRPRDPFTPQGSDSPGDVGRRARPS